MGVLAALAVFLFCAQLPATAQTPDWRTLVDQAKNCYHDGEYKRGIETAKQALEIAEQTRGVSHPDVAETLDILGWLYREEGDEQQRLSEQVTGPLEVFPARRIQGYSAQAEQMFKRALAIREKTLETDHLDIAASLYSLGVLYLDQGHYTHSHKGAGFYAKAKPFLRRALSIRENKLDPDHPDLASSLNGLANLYLAEGENAQAEPLYTRALAINEKMLGPDHPSVAMLLNNLALAKRDQGKYAEAEPLLARSLMIYENGPTPDHPDAGGTLTNMAELYRRMGRDEEAKRLDHRAAAIRNKVR